MADIITVAIEKGGVGKTSTVVNLAALTAMDGKRTLVVDMDSQANTTYMLTGENKMSMAFRDRGIFDMIRAHGLKPTKDFISKTQIENLDIIPSNAQTPKTVGMLQILENGKTSQNIFLLLCLAEVADDYDYIIVDTPPSRDALTMNALVASDYVLIPCKCDNFSLDSLSTTYEICSMLSESENTEIKIIGIVLTIVERTALTQTIREELRESEYGTELLQTEIRKGQVVSDSTRFASPVVIYAKSSTPAKDYVSLYHELMERIARIESEEANG